MDFTVRKSLYGAVPLSHLFLKERVRAGDRVVDATCGNGRDTELLAGLVGPAGKVWAFDVQPRALEATRTLLTEAGVMSQVELLSAGHERLGELVEGPLRAVIFNLGYLPGGDREVTTRPATTLPALDAGLHLLGPEGIIVVVVYTGHPEARDEEEAVLGWAAGLDPAACNVWSSRQLNRSAAAPYVILVEKVGLIPCG